MKKKFLTVAMASTMVISSVFSAMAADVKVSTVYEEGQTIDGTAGWNTADGDNYSIAEKSVVVNFTNFPFTDAKPISATNAATDENWDNFVIETVASADAEGITMRADAASWLYGDATENTPVITNERSWADDWDAFKTICKENTDITLTAEKTSDTQVVFTIEFGTVATEKYTIEYPNGVPADLKFHVGADGAKIVVDEVVYNEVKNPSSNTGDVEVDNPSSNTGDAEADKVPTTNTDAEKVPTTNTDADRIPATGTDAVAGEITEEIAAGILEDILANGGVKGDVPEGAELKVKPVSKDAESFKEMFKYAMETLKAKAFAIIDLTLEVNGAKVQPLNNGKVAITLTAEALDMKDAKWIEVSRFDDDAKKIVKLGTFEVKDGKFTFETDHFSTYLFAAVDAPEAGEDATLPGNEQTGDTAPVAPIVAVAVAALGAVVVASSKKKNA